MKTKPISELAVGDWILVDSMIMSRHVSRPWEVTGISHTRVHLQRYRTDHITKEVEISDSKYIYTKSIRFVFADGGDAEAAFAFAQRNSDVYEKAARELRQSHDKLFHDYMASLS